MIGSGDGRNRILIRSGCIVDIIRKEDQQSGKKTRGIVQDILTSSLTHPHGIKVRLSDRQVGRVAAIIDPRLSSSDPCENPHPQSKNPAESFSKK